MKLEAKNLLDALSEKGINYKLFEHEAFYTVEESSRLKNDLDMHGAHTKNLFLRDKKRNFYLLSCLDNQEIDLKEIKNALQCQGNLSFGSPEYLYEKLGVKPGSVSPYALVCRARCTVRSMSSRILTYIRSMRSIQFLEYG